MTIVRVGCGMLRAVCAGFLFLLTCLCLSEIPELLRGPIGFKPEPPLILKMVREIVPTVWSSVIGGALFAVITFREGCSRKVSPLDISLTLFGFMGCMGLVYAWLMIREHAVYAVDPVNTSHFRVAANIAIVGVLGLLAWAKPLTQCIPPTTPQAHD